MKRVSVVVPFYNAEATVGACIAALNGQSVPSDDYEIIAVDDGSTDAGATVAERAGATVIRQNNGGASAARNTGMAAATGKWIAFTDADCVPSRGWLAALLQAVGESQGTNGDGVLGAAGPIVGFGSESPAARFVDVSGGLDAKRHLSHPLFPFAVSGNVMYLREALMAVGGFDERFVTYEACDLHTRLRRNVGGPFEFSDSAVVLHAHRDSWGAYWRQQLNYGRGLAQFYIRYRDEIEWSPLREAGAWATVAGRALKAAVAPRNDEGLVARGTFVKDLAQRTGFVRTYFSRGERRRWERTA